MADDQTDADFFDKLVDDDAAPAPAPANSALARDVSVLSLADDDPPTLPPAPETAPPSGAAQTMALIHLLSSQEPPATTAFSGPRPWRPPRAPRIMTCSVQIIRAWPLR